MSEKSCFITYVALFVFLSTTSFIMAQSNPWSTKAPMPTARRLFSASVVHGKIYAIGGTESNILQPLGIVEEYDPTTNTWDTTKTPMPTPRILFTTSTVDGIIYVIGSGPFNRTVEAYDPVIDNWTTKADMPTARAALSSTVVNGKIYVMGGTHPPNYPALKVLEVYDPMTNTWDPTKAEMLHGRWGAAACAVNGKIYVIGGNPSGGSW